MPNGLTQEQWKQLADLLRVQADELRELLLLADESARPVDLDAPIGRLSRMDAMQNQQMASANRASHAARLRLIDEAIEALSDGSYGLCVACDQPVGFPRLQAVPEAPTCLSCKTREESGS